MCRCAARRMPKRSRYSTISKRLARRIEFFIPCGEIFVLQPHIVLRRIMQLLDLRIGEPAQQPRWIADPQLAFADDLARPHPRARADHRMATDARAVEH